MKFGKIELKNSTANKVVESDADNVLIGTRNISSNYATAESNDLLTKDAIISNLLPNQIFYMRDEKSTGTVSQTLVGAVDNVRDLNTVLHNEISGATLDVSGSIFHLPAGTYEYDLYSNYTDYPGGVTAGAPAYYGVISLFNETVSATVDHNSQYSWTNFTEPIIDFDGHLKGRMILSGDADFTLRVRTGNSTPGGTPLNVAGFSEIYSRVFITKVAGV